MAFVYILHSNEPDRFYVGSCLVLEDRLEEHFSKRYPDSFTARNGKWELFLAIENLEYNQARRIEMHIKKMKSKTYIRNLKLYGELVTKIIEKYK